MATLVHAEGAAPESSASAPRGRRSQLKVALNAFSFNRVLTQRVSGGEPRLDLFQLIDFCADQGFDAVDLTGYYFPGYPGVPATDYLNRVKRHVFKAGMEISGTGVKNNFTDPDPQKRAADARHIQQWIEVASRLGAPVLRIFAGLDPAPGTSWQEAANRMVEELKPCVAHAEKFGIILGMQNHADMLKTADEIIEVVTKVNSPWFGVINDTGSYITADTYVDIARVIPHTVNWQIKQRSSAKAGGEALDLVRLMRLIRDGGYRGYLPIETLSVAGQPYDPFIEVPKMLAAVRSALAATA